MSSIGEKGEELTAKYLSEKGYSIIKMNYYSRFGEIDIIAVNPHNIAFVEVKTRKRAARYSGAWDVTRGKQKKIIKTALLFLQENNYDLQPRFDVAVVEHYKGDFAIDYIESAFDGSY